MAEADLSRLPGLVLVQLFQMLPVSDRGHLACCSSRLSAMIGCRAVWTDVVIALDMETQGEHDFTIECVDRLSSRDWTMIQKYSKYFRNVKVVMSSGYLEEKSFDVLRELCGRQVIKNLTLGFDMFLFISKAVKCIGKPPLLHFRNCMWAFPFDMIEPSNGWVLPVQAASPVGDLIERLGPQASLSIEFPSDGMGRKHITAAAVEAVGLGIIDFILYFYRSLLPEKCCSLLKKLELSTESDGEETLQGFMSPAFPPTAGRISDLTCLEELHVNIVNLSEELLLKLSEASRKRSPLRKLVIRQLHSRYSTLPQLSSSAWGQLTQASPALTVECYVRVFRLPGLCDVIKPETPLVRLEVVCSTSDEQCRLQLYQLCADHSSTLQRLTLSVSRDVEQRTAVQERLKKMAQACPRLQHLLCNSDIDGQLLGDLARDS